MLLRQRFPLATVAFLAGALGLPAAAPAAPQPVTGGELRWAQANVYETGAPAGTNRTWLGYVTSVGPPFTSGRAFPTAPASGPTVTPTSARGADRAYTFVYPVAAGGTYDPETRTGVIQLRGTVTFSSDAHGFAITVANPRVEVGPSSARLFAEGQGTPRDGAPKPYGATQPVFDLTGGLEALAPAIATPGLVWDEGSYPKGAGPDRTPNTFGTLSLAISTDAAAPPPPPVARPAKPKPTVRCRARVRRTRCSVAGVSGAHRLVVMAGRRRLATTRFRRGTATVTLRGRRTVTFKIVDRRNRELARSKKRIGRPS